MHFLNIRRQLDEIVDDELGLVGSPRAFEFLHRNHTDVYRIRAGGRRFIAHASSGSKAYLRRVWGNLERLADLQDGRIPRVVAWRASNGGVLPGYEWAVLVYGELEGKALNAANFSAGAWTALGDLLRRVHQLEGETERSTAPVHRHGEAPALSAFSQALLLRIDDLPFRVDRVATLLDELGDYAAARAASFRIEPRLIHGDLDRTNIIVGPGAVGLVDWGAMGTGDYAFDLAMLRFVLDSVAPRLAHRLVGELAGQYRTRFSDGALETRLRFYAPLAGLVKAYEAAGDTREDPESRARQVWARFLYAESQWRVPVHLDDNAPPVAGRWVA
jgi:aminoglycoside phosphotransferase (APT) family kinase protein